MDDGPDGTGAETTALTDAVPPEPARPSAAGPPQRTRVRDTRLEAAPGRLSLTRGGRLVRSLTVGADGDVATAAHLGGPVLADVAPHSLGAVDLLAPDGSRVARIELGDWVPEADELTRHREALGRSGVAELLEQAGIPVRPVPPSELAAAVTASPPQLTPWRRLPLAYTVLRSARSGGCGRTALGDPGRRAARRALDGRRARAAAQHPRRRRLVGGRAAGRP